MAQVKMKIIDISSYQGELTNDAVSKIKAQGVGVILRLGFTGYGTNKPSLDSCFLANYEKLHNAGIPVGAYYFTIAFTSDMVKAEGDFILSTLQGKKFELPIYIDVEAQSNSVGWSALSGSARAFLVSILASRIEHAGYYVGIYASKSWLTTSKYLDMTPLKHFDTWVAQYNVICTYSGNYNLWQYSSKEKASTYGITKTSVVDISNAYVDFPSIIKSKGLNNYSDNVFVVCPKCGELIQVN